VFKKNSWCNYKCRLRPRRKTLRTKLGLFYRQNWSN